MSDGVVRAQDEILQMMYWMRGEHLGDDVSPAQLNRFLKIDSGDLESAIERLVRRDLISRTGDMLRLTDGGIAEGKRRFLDEFSSYLGKDTHLSCSDPNCDCGSPEFDGACLSANRVVR